MVTENGETNLEPDAKKLKGDDNVKKTLKLSSDYGKFEVFLFDIEGTTTPITFVKDVLFPYVVKNVKSHLESHWEDEECKKDVSSLIEQSREDVRAGLRDEPLAEDASVDDVTSYVTGLVEADRKVGALKQLQGHMWRAGYRHNHFTSTVYDDVLEFFKVLNLEGKRCCIYSSGSIEAQKDLFKFSNLGDLSSYLSGYFDTTSGPKQESTSYANIAKSLSVDIGQIVFFTDVLKEAEAAKEAGIEAVLLLRAGNAPIEEKQLSKFVSIDSFEKLLSRL